VIGKQQWTFSPRHQCCVWIVACILQCCISDDYGPAWKSK